MTASSPTASILAQPTPPLWVGAGLFLATDPKARGFAAAVDLAHAARRACDSEPAVARARLGRAQAVMADEDSPAPDAEDPLIHAAIAVRASFGGRPDILQALDRVLQAAQRDANGTPCLSWGELLTLGQFASVPIGRALLAAAGDEDARTVARTDRLFQASFVVERICGAKYAAQRHGRCDLPPRWAGEASHRLDDSLSDAKIRRMIIDRMLDGAHGLLATDAERTHREGTAALRATMALLRCRAQRLIRRLRTTDPFISVVTPRQIDDALCRFTARFIDWLG